MFDAWVIGVMRKLFIWPAVFCLSIFVIFIAVGDQPNINVHNDQLQGGSQDQPVKFEQRSDTNRLMQSFNHSGISDTVIEVQQLGMHPGVKVAVEIENGARKEECKKNGTRKEECKKKLPTALIIGARKSGTGTLLEFLGLHPHIMRTQNDELAYFHSGYRKGDAWYLSRMPCSFACDVIIEKSPEYFHHEQVPKRVLKQNPEMKLLLIVKDPVRRVVSNYMHDKRKTHKIISPGKVRGRSLESMILTPTGAVKNNSDYIQVSTYHAHLENWYKWFPREQILILDGKLLMEEPSRLLQEVEVFFGLEHKLTSDLFYFDDKKGFFCYKKGDEDMCMPHNKGTTPVQISQELNNTLTNYFKPLNEKFFRLVNQTFDW